MDPLQSIAQFWSWLPALRAIAETCHLPSAAQALGLTPSALSRSLSQLERTLGAPLFRRSKGRLELLPEGERFLAALRDAMRLVHEASLDLKSERWLGGMAVASTGLATSAWVLPALIALRAQHPELRPRLTTDVSEATARLLSGELDLVFTEQEISSKRLRTVCLGRFRRSIYGGADHPLAQVATPGIEDLRAYAFVAPPRGEHELDADGWPASEERRIGLEVDQLRIGCEALQQSQLLAVLPDVVAEALGGGKLRRLNLDIAHDAEVFAILRTDIGLETRAESLLAEVQRRVRASTLLARRPPQS